MSDSNKGTSKNLRILVTPLNSYGHINACHGLCDELRQRGHQVIFLIDEEFAGKLTKFGFEERYIQLPKPKGGNAEKIGFWPDFVARNVDKYALPSIEQMSQLMPIIFQTMFEQQCDLNDQYAKAIEEIKPDLIINDCYVCCPALINSGIPWVWLFSASPHQMLMDSRLPPFYSGLPLNGDKKEWEQFRQVTIESLSPIMKAINEYSVAKGVQPFENRLHPMSTFLNLYMWPREMRYPELDELPQNIIGVDCFVRKLPEQTFEIPEKLQNKPGKLIFFSMGSFGCTNLKLMTRLVKILANSPHRFIVSKGPLEYDLADNMWGDVFLPQIAILKMVDFVITHGGNNTITETFYFGKKMLVMPIFADQYDNAQRIAEVGLGARLNPFECTEKELLNIIELLADDDHLTRRMAKIGERIRKSNDKEKVADYIEKVLCK